MGPGPIPWLVAGEYLPAEYKMGAQAALGFGNWLLCFIIGLAFPVMNAAIGGYSFTVFGVCCVLSFVYIYAKMIESKGCSVDQLQERFGRSSVCC